MAGGERDNIARSAELAFDAIVKPFGWKGQGPMNTEFDCEQHKKHSQLATDPTTHPVDAVYYYDDPYQPVRIVANVDYKSYAKSSLDSPDLGGALRSLSATIDCAAMSKKYQETFHAHAPERDHEVVGLLFVFNHDGDYDLTKFPNVMKRVADDALDPPRKKRMFVIGPPTIRYLSTISTEIRARRGEEDLQGYEQTFFHPNLVGKPASSEAALSLESLLGPWQIVKLSGVRNGVQDTQYDVYSPTKGDNADGLEYLLDYFFRFQLLLDARSSITLRLPFADPSFQNNLDLAKAMYARKFHNLPEVVERLRRVTAQTVHAVHLQFKADAIGMQRRTSMAPEVKA